MEQVGGKIKGRVNLDLIEVFFLNWTNELLTTCFHEKRIPNFYDTIKN